MTTTRFCIIRHGETDWNAEKRIQGQTDIPLNATGRAQALAMAMHASRHVFQTIFSSDLVRAKDTAHALADSVGLPVCATASLRERHFGFFQGLTRKEAKSRYPEAYVKYTGRDLNYAFDTGESLIALAERAWHAIEEISRHHAGFTVAVVTHAGVLDVLYRRATGRPLDTERDFPIPNCALNWFSLDASGWRVEAWDDQRHLPNARGESAE